MFSIPSNFLSKINYRAKDAAGDAATAAIACALAWLIALYLFDQPRPLFAAITALICLAPGLPSHAMQSINIVVGVLVGMAVSEVILRIPIEPMSLKLGIAVFLAIVAASALGLAVAVPIQSGVTAALIIAYGSQMAGPSRFLDVVVGSGVGLLFSQVLLTPNLGRLLDKAANGLLDDIAKSLALIDDGLKNNSVAQTRKAVEHIVNANSRIQNLENVILETRRSARWSLRGRMQSASLKLRIARYSRRGVRLYANMLLLAEAANDGLRKQAVGEASAPPAALLFLIAGLSSRCRQAADNRPASETGNAEAASATTDLTTAEVPENISATAGTDPVWAKCIDLTVQTAATLQRFVGSNRR